MKTLVAVILALAIGFAAACVIVSRQKDAQLEQLKSQPQVAAVAIPAAAPEEKIVMAPAPAAAAPAVESPQEILDELFNVKVGEGSSRNAALRLVVFKLETLKQIGAAAVPAIRAFIGRNVDVDYSQQNAANSDSSASQAAGVGRGFNRGNAGGFAGGLGRNSPARRARNLQTLQTDWLVPPSLRLGLVGVLKQIGGADSEQALAEMLNRTGRGVEIAYLTVALEDIAPGKYQNTAVAAAKELLLTPPAIDNPDNLDQLSKSYLYGVLEFYKDTSFAGSAQQMLVGADGRLDQDATDYLATVLKEQAVSAFYAAYENPALTNQADRMLIRNHVLNYVGQNSQANAVLTETLDDPNVDSRIKAITLIGLADGENDPQAVSAKITLFNSLLDKYAGDPMLSKALAAAINNLQNPGQPVQAEDIISLGQGGGRRGGGNANMNGQ
jgi:hypothetical protein